MSTSPPSLIGPGRRLAIWLEQVRQARRIHGGFLRLCLAAAVVKLSRLPIPSRRLRLRLFRDLYARMYPPGLNAEEADRPLEDYRSMYDLFTRGVKPEHRPIPADGRALLSPCDGVVQDIGRVERGRLLTVKGIEYSVASLLGDGDDEDAKPYEGGAFAIVFLSPIDCHRVFSPMDGRLGRVAHIPGARLLVHPPFQRPEFPVYTLNERAVFRLEGGGGSCAVVMVAGWGVGNITSPLAPWLRARPRRVESRTPDPPPAVRRGSWLATFGLGSTVVLISSSSPEATPLVFPNEKVRYGQPIFRLA
ncbi:archaetidylserine decarboxylase [Aquisphaera insulae]|uniref:archaetidylserine decarboxylase n=1 Tax=Aquisphaera insulae TaxID=2712864 RepID=UPI0013EA1FD6|nr:archaetidylserine decarboxylase [Aquisphaera insulae]